MGRPPAPPRAEEAIASPREAFATRRALPTRRLIPVAPSFAEYVEATDRLLQNSQKAVDSSPARRPSSAFRPRKQRPSSAPASGPHMLDLTAERLRMSLPDHWLEATCQDTSSVLHQGVEQHHSARAVIEKPSLIDQYPHEEMLALCNPYAEKQRGRRQSSAVLRQRMCGTVSITELLLDADAAPKQSIGIRKAPFSGQHGASPRCGSAPKIRGCCGRTRPHSALPIPIPRTSRPTSASGYMLSRTRPRQSACGAEFRPEQD